MKETSLTLRKPGESAAPDGGGPERVPSGNRDRPARSRASNRPTWAAPKRLLRFGGLLALAILAWLLPDWGEVGASLRSTQPLPAFAAAICLLGSVSLRAIRWKIAAQAAGVRYRNLRDHFLVYYAGFSSGLVLPTAAAPFTQMVLLSSDGHSSRRSFIGIALETSAGVTFALIVALVGALYVRPNHPGFAVTIASASLLGLAGITAGLLVLFFADAIFARIKRALGEQALLIRMLRPWVASDLRSVFLEIRNHLPVIAAVSVGSALLQIVSLILLARTVGVEASAATLSMAWAIVFVVQLIPASVGGLGIREGSLALVFVTIGEPKELGVALGLLMFAVVTALRLPGLLLWFWRPKPSPTFAVTAKASSR